MIRGPRVRARAQVSDAGAMAGREYRLVVEGELSDQTAPAFAGMALTRENGKTVLVGPVRDQAELQGLLRRISDLGLTLLSATAVEDVRGTPSSQAARSGAIANDRLRADAERLLAGPVARHELSLAFEESTASSAEVLVEGRTFYPPMLADIEAAASSVHVNQFGFRPGKIGDAFAEALIRKAGQGAPVRLVVDRQGSDPEGGSQQLYERLRAAGIEICVVRATKISGAESAQRAICSVIRRRSASVKLGASTYGMTPDSHGQLATRMSSAAACVRGRGSARRIASWSRLTPISPIQMVCVSSMGGSTQMCGFPMRGACALMAIVAPASTTRT